MTDRHTTGPWGIKTFPQGFFTVTAIMDGGNVICLSPAPEYRNLICAAPDILSALELIEIDKEGDGFICREAMDQVRAAIRKARGES